MESIVDKSDSAVLKTEMKEYSALLKDFIVVLEDLAKAVEAEDYAAMGSSGAALTEYYLSLEEAQQGFNETLANVVGEVTAERIESITKSNRLTVITFVLFSFFMLSNIFITTVFISRPAKNADAQLSKILDKLNREEGDLTERITAKSNDEIGQLIKGVNGLLDMLQSKMGILKTETLNMNHSVQQITKGIAESNENATGVSAVMEELSASMQEVTVTLTNVSDGVQDALSISK